MSKKKAKVNEVTKRGWRSSHNKLKTGKNGDKHCKTVRATK